MRRYILSHFLDTPKAPLSLHRIACVGETLGRRIGEWHAPSLTSRCISQLVNSELSVGLRSYSAIDMTIDEAIILELLDGAKVLVWIPMRLGVENLNSIYIEPVKVQLDCGRLFL